MARVVRIHDNGEIVSGASYLFRSYDSAMKASRKATANPRVKMYWSSKGDFYAGLADTFIRSDGTRGSFVYGKGGLVEVVEV